MIAGAIAEPSMSKATVAKMTDAFFGLKRLQPFQVAPQILVIEGKPTFIDNKGCRPAVRTAPRWKRYDSTAGAAPFNQAFGLKRLDRASPKALGIRRRASAGKVRQQQ